jgi:hypothetical protein
MGTLQDRAAKLEMEKRSAIEVIKSAVPPVLSVGSFGVDHLIAKEEDIIQQDPAQAKRQSCIIQSSKVDNKLEAVSGHDPF